MCLCNEEEKEKIVNGIECEVETRMKKKEEAMEIYYFFKNKTREMSAREEEP